MKIRSLLLGSVAAAGLTTAGYATDLGVVTSLNVCDELGLSGLTISSDDNCLVITGGVSYEFKWGDYNDSLTLSGFFDIDGSYVTVDVGDTDMDWESHLDAWLQFQASADSSFGVATATIKLLAESDANDNNNSSDNNIVVDEAYITIGDTTMLTVGRTGSIFNSGDDEPLNFLGLFNSNVVDAGVGHSLGWFRTGGEVIQVVSDLGNGLWVGGGLEDLDNEGTAVGVISYSGDGLSAHVSVAADDILYGSFDDWIMHAGFTGTFDNFKVVGAVAMDSLDWWNALGSASATFDMFTIAVSAEATSNEEYGFGGSLGATVSDGITLNLGGKYFKQDDWGPNDEDWITQVAAQIVASVSDDVTLTGEVGGYFTGPDAWTPDYGVYYGKVKAAWAPGGGVDASVAAEVNTEGAWSTDFTISKSIK